MSVACARSSETQASSPRRPGTWSSTSRSKSSATSVVSGSICTCTYFGKVFATAIISGEAARIGGTPMTTEIELELDESIQRRFGTVADDARVVRTAGALEANGIRVLRAGNAAEAKQIVLDLIPDGSQVHSGASLSLDVAGISEEIEGSARYEAVRPHIFSLDRDTQADEIRRLSA